MPIFPNKQVGYIAASCDSILEGMASVVENRYNNTGGHIKRISEVVRLLNTLFLTFLHPFLQKVHSACRNVPILLIYQ